MNSLNIPLFSCNSIYKFTEKVSRKNQYTNIFLFRKNRASPILKLSLLLA